MTNLKTFAREHLASAAPLDVQAAPTAMTVTYADVEDNDAFEGLPRFALSFSMLDTGQRIGNADLMMITDGRRVIDHVVPGADPEVTEAIESAADRFAERYRVKSARALGELLVNYQDEPEA